MAEKLIACFTMRNVRVVSDVNILLTLIALKRRSQREDFTERKKKYE
jgi:hypothetical protein